MVCIKSILSFLCQNIDDQRHLLRYAPFLEKLTPEQQTFILTVNYEDIYDCLDGQRSAATVFYWLLEAMEELLEFHLPVGDLLRGTEGDWETSPSFCKICHHVERVAILCQMTFIVVEHFDILG